VPFSGVILAGGRGSRLGIDKAQVEIGGEPLLERVVRSLSQVTDEIIVVVADLAKGHPKLAANNIRFVGDLFLGSGSLGGIYTGLSAATHYHSMVVACDMPFLNLALLQYLRSRATEADVVVPRLGPVLEPLHAVYSKKCLPAIAELLRRRQLRIIDFFASVQVSYVEADEVDRFDPQRLSFFNINTPENLAYARSLVLARNEGS